MVDKCSVIKYPDSWGFKREPARPVTLRRDYFNGMQFDENFDWNNLWYDAVQIAHDCVLLIGPPLYDTKNFLTQNCQFTANNCALSFNCIDMDRAGLTIVHVPGIVNELILHPSGTVIKVNTTSSEFENRKCLMTLQKDNPISWIKEWIRYNRDNYSIDGILIYDNQSTQYTAEELEFAIQTENVTVKVVEWYVPYGPQGFDCNYYNTWDSDYAQSSMFEHSKRRYLSNAQLAINCDIDELLVLKNTTLDYIIETIKKENLAGYIYRGKWIEPYDINSKVAANELSLNERSFANYYCIDTNKRALDAGRKWMVIPNKSLNYQWCVHHTNAPMRENNEIYYGHYMPMNTNWSWNRDNYSADTSTLVVDHLLRHNLSKLRNNQ